MISKHCLAVHEQILRFCLFARIHNTTFLQLSLFHEHAVLIFVLKSKLLSRRFFCSLATVDITDFNILANFTKMSVQTLFNRLFKYSLQK